MGANTVESFERFGGPAHGAGAPSNVIEVKSESSEGSHCAPFPQVLVEFFLLAFSDAGDVIHDPFFGSGTTMAAAELLDRVGYGCESRQPTAM